MRKKHEKNPKEQDTCFIRFIDQAHNWNQPTEAKNILWGEISQFYFFARNFTEVKTPLFSKKFAPKWDT